MFGILSCDAKKESSEAVPQSDTVALEKDAVNSVLQEPEVQQDEAPMADFVAVSDEAPLLQPMMDIVEPETSENMSLPEFDEESEKKDFKVILSVDSLMYLGQSGMLQVWIGREDVDVSFSKGMTQDVKTMSSTIGKFAKITPFAPDFEIEAISTIVCHKIDPNGSEVSFGLVPKDEGNYRVSANIDLFETPDCTGISVPKTAKVLSVFVGVDMKKEISKKVHEMESVAWDKFKIFWVALMTLIFGAAIFVIRRFIKNKTGYEEGPSDS